jgi:hypothetical protein
MTLDALIVSEHFDRFDRFFSVNFLSEWSSHFKSVLDIRIRSENIQSLS